MGCVTCVIGFQYCEYKNRLHMSIIHIKCLNSVIGF